MIVVLLDDFDLIFGIDCFVKAIVSLLPCREECKSHIGIVLFLLVVSLFPKINQKLRWFLPRNLNMG